MIEKPGGERSPADFRSDGVLSTLINAEARLSNKASAC